MAASLAIEKPHVYQWRSGGRLLTTWHPPTAQRELAIWALALVPPLLLLAVGLLGSLVPYGFYAVPFGAILLDGRRRPPALDLGRPPHGAVPERRRPDPGRPTRPRTRSPRASGRRTPARRRSASPTTRSRWRWRRSGSRSCSRAGAAARSRPGSRSPRTSSTPAARRRWSAPADACDFSSLAAEAEEQGVAVQGDVDLRAPPARGGRRRRRDPSARAPARPAPRPGSPAAIADRAPVDVAAAPARPRRARCAASASEASARSTGSPSVARTAPSPAAATRSPARPAAASASSSVSCSWKHRLVASALDPRGEAEVVEQRAELLRRRLDHAHVAADGLVRAPRCARASARSRRRSRAVSAGRDRRARRGAGIPGCRSSPPW